MNVRRLCSIAGVSRCGFYKYYGGYQSNRALKDKVLAEAVDEIQQRHHFSVGYRKMVPLLQSESGMKTSPRKVRRIMKEKDLQSTVRPKKYTAEIYLRRKQMKESLPPDLIRRKFFSLEPFKRMVEDITYLPCLEQTMYLNSIEDMFNGEIPAYAISEMVDSKLCTDTVDILAGKIGDTQGVILHSDLGSTYLSYAYRDLLEKLGMRMSLGGVCYDNAAMESLNSIIKTECLYCRFGKSNVKNHKVPKKDVIAAVVEFIEYYNTTRPKESLGFLSPVEFRLKNPKGTYPVVIT
ncbi:MAG: IS3 family transposase [Sphaerochaeta sp.]|jgi:transposase InsO family protein|uniref:IS3 family transposase n=1 Tax=Sphaerochaeta sp. UBA5849 TaxID=1947475 RepID=UPI002B3E8196|nr:IS3 family transposase [Sphaerochaeta sp.]